MKKKKKNSQLKCFNIHEFKNISTIRNIFLINFAIENTFEEAALKE